MSVGLPVGWVGLRGFGGWAISNGIEADPCGCEYRSVFGHMVHDAVRLYVR